jgi:hypothetical protein
MLYRSGDGSVSFVGPRRLFCHNATWVGGAESRGCYNHPPNQANISHTLRHRDNDHDMFTHRGGRPLHRVSPPSAASPAPSSSDTASPVSPSSVSPRRDTTRNEPPCLGCPLSRRCHPPPHFASGEREREGKKEAIGRYDKKEATGKRKWRRYGKRKKETEKEERKREK